MRGFFLCIYVLLFLAVEPIVAQQLQNKCSFWSWDTHKINFGVEKIRLGFPDTPQVVQSSTLITAICSEKRVLYTFSGYFPPIGNIVPSVFFNQMLNGVSQGHCILLDHSIYQIENGYWVLDFITQDTSRLVYIKSRSIITPFNAYTLQCVFPYGAHERFDHFLQEFRILCCCDD